MRLNCADTFYEATLFAVHKFKYIRVGMIPFYDGSSNALQTRVCVCVCLFVHTDTKRASINIIAYLIARPEMGRKVLREERAANMTTERKRKTCWQFRLLWLICVV